MKAKNISKRVLSVILCTVMLFSCWVFTAPMANAATVTGTVNGSGYLVRIHTHETNAMNIKNDNKSPTDSGVATDEYCNIYYKEKNGTGTEKTYTQILADKDGSGHTDVFSDGGQSDGYFPSESGVRIYGFPTAFYAQVYKKDNNDFHVWPGNTKGDFECTLQMYYNNKWNDIGYKKSNTVDGIGWAKCDKTNTTIALPKATTNTNPTVAYASSSLTVPKSGSVNNAISITNTPVDQYGTTMETNISVNCPTQSTGITQSGATTQIGTDAHIAGITNSQKLTATVSWPQSASGGISKTTSFTLYDEKYDVKFYNLGAQVGTTQSIYYGSAATDPGAQTKAADDTNHYTWAGWDKTFNNITADTNVNNKTYTSTAHSYSWVSNGSTATDTHSYKCSVCNHIHSTKTETHNITGQPYKSDATGHWKECSVCGAKIDKVAHNPKDAVTESEVPATCETGGSYKSVVYCEDCNYKISETSHTKDALDHNFGEWTDYDNATQHQRVCSRDANHIDYEDHNWSGWQHVVPTEEETGVRATVRAKLTEAGYSEENSCFNYCTVCGYTKTQSHHDWTVVEDDTVTYPATCEAAGQTTSECPDCHKTKVTPIAATGHTWVRWDGCNEEKISELSGAVPVILKCKNGCNKFCSSYYDEKTHKYESTGNAGDYEYVIGQDTASIPTPSFNEHFEYFDGQIMEPYHYRERKASLRVRPSEKEDDTQAIRFSGNLTAGNIVDAGVKFNFNPKLIIKNYTEDMPAKDAKLMSLEEIRNNRDAYDDKTVIDFGFVFTQARFIRSAKETIDYDLMTLDNIGTNYRIYRMSVVGNNLDNFRDDKTIENWKGLTMIGEEATFNLVIDVNKKNYQATYVARTYVIYKYHGDIICVYDQPYENYEWDNEKGENVPNHYYSHDSVYNQAHKVLTLTEPTDFVKSYLEDKIINNTATQNFVDWNWNYTLKDFPKVEED